MTRVNNTKYYQNNIEQRTVIIAEAGVNHNGDIETAKKLIDVAADAGVDYVKFQTFNAIELASDNAKKAAYQAQRTNVAETQRTMLERLSLDERQHKILMRHCALREVKFLSTAFDFSSIELLERLSIPIHKIPSGEITNLPHLIQIAKTGKPVILSTGMSVMDEIRKAVGVLNEYGAGTVTVLHCNTEYPTPYNDVHLRAMTTIQETLGVPVGYSDHTAGIEVAIAAVALGAVIIEKHFTLDKNMEGPDHKASLEPIELCAMVQAIRNVEKAMGRDTKEPTPSEIKNINIVRKSIVARKDIEKGSILTEENMTVKRPGGGISPMEWFSVLGSAANRDYREDEMIVR